MGLVEGGEGVVVAFEESEGDASVDFDFRLLSFEEFEGFVEGV